MNRWIANTKYVLLGLFLIASLGAAAYQWWVIWPARKCDETAAWWDARDHQCLVPMPIWRITGRLPSAPSPATPPAARPKG
jgi:hypothetical protein